MDESGRFSDLLSRATLELPTHPRFNDLPRHLRPVVVPARKVSVAPAAHKHLGVKWFCAARNRGIIGYYIYIYIRILLSFWRLSHQWFLMLLKEIGGTWEYSDSDAQGPLVHIDDIHVTNVLA